MGMMLRGLFARVVAATLAMGGFVMAGSSPSGAASSTYVTIQIAHTAASLTDRNCQPLPNVVTLEKQAATYRALAITGVTGTVITSWMKPTTQQCRRPYLMASWQEMVALQRNYGWTFVGGSLHGTSLTKMDPNSAKAEICQSGLTIKQHGLTGAFGEFAFPDDQTNIRLEQQAIACGYAFGRKYGGGRNILPVAWPYLLHTQSVNGGACADPTKACYQLPTPYRYTDPASLAVLGRLNPGHWGVIQGYSFVTGAVTSNTVSWDCTSPEWREHWTTGGVGMEIYCWNDWLSALKSWHGDNYVTPNQMRTQRQP